MEHIDISGVPHFIFDTVGEFRQFFERTPHGVPTLWENWREAPEGAWILSDDGRILQILKRSAIKGAFGVAKTQHPNGYCRTAIGTFFCDDGILMDTNPDKHPSRYTFSGRKGGGLGYRPKCGITRKERLWMVQLIRGADPYDAYETVFGSVEPAYLIARVTKLLSEARIMKALREEVKEALNEEGIDIKKLIRLTVQIAESEDATESARLSAIKMLRDDLEAVSENAAMPDAPGRLPHEAEIVGGEVDSGRDEARRLAAEGAFVDPDEKVQSVVDQTAVPESGESDAPFIGDEQLAN